MQNKNSIDLSQTSSFDYVLPEELIAQDPVEPRDACRLLIASRAGDSPFKHVLFKNLSDHLHPGDLLVLNDTRVLPARLQGVKKNGGAKVEVLFLNENKTIENESVGKTWTALVKPGRKLPMGTAVVLEDGTEIIIGKKLDDGVREVYFKDSLNPLLIMEKLGRLPLPHYITNTHSEPEQYQTVYAKKEKENSVASPTAGLHFTQELLEKLDAKGIKRTCITLRVGLGTFRPVKEELISKHIMHKELCEVSDIAAKMIIETKKRGGRIIAVGTTVVRTLESFAKVFGTIRSGSLETDLFITPGYKFKVVDALITNFHLPKSTLLMLVAAFGGYDNLLSIYQEAISERYRFFSFGDSLFLN